MNDTSNDNRGDRLFEQFGLEQNQMHNAPNAGKQRVVVSCLLARFCELESYLNLSPGFRAIGRYQSDA